VHNFNIQEQMKIFGITYFHMDDLMPIVNKQVSAKIPRYMNDWSKEQFDFMVKFMCDRIHFEYWERTIYNSYKLKATERHNLYNKFNATCYPTPFESADMWRVMFFFAIPNYEHKLTG